MAVRSLPGPVVKLLRDYRELLRGAFGERLVEVKLFGSFARGDWDEDSDVDICVVVSGLTEAERSRAVDLAFLAWRRTGGGRGPLIAPLVWSQTERDHRLALERRIAIDIASEGVTF